MGYRFASRAVLAALCLAVAAGGLQAAAPTTTAVYGPFKPPQVMAAAKAPGTTVLRVSKPVASAPAAKTGVQKSTAPAKVAAPPKTAAPKAPAVRLASVAQVKAMPVFAGAPVKVARSSAQAPAVAVAVAPVVVPIAPVAPVVVAQPNRTYDDIPPPVQKERTLEVGDSERLTSPRDITRTAVSDPEVMDMLPVSTKEVLVNARKAGKAIVRLWDDRGWLTTYTYTIVGASKPVTHTMPPAQLAKEIEGLIGVPTIKATVVGDSVILRGTAPSAEVVQAAAGVAQAFDKKVTNLVTVSAAAPQSVVDAIKSALTGTDLTYSILSDGTVMIQGSVATEEEAVRVKDVLGAWITTDAGARNGGAASAQITFGAGRQETAPDVVEKALVEAYQPAPGSVVVREEYNVARRVFAGRVPNGPRILALIDVNPAIAKQLLVTAQVLEVDSDRLKDLGVEWGSLVDGSFQEQPFVVTERREGNVPLGDLGPFSRLPFAAQVNALIQENAARILSEPKLLIADGHAANILVGGEIPIPVAQNATVGSTSITVMYKPFGIQLTVRPKLTPDGRILLTVTPEVSDLDFTNAVRSAGIEIPALTVRRATTTVHVSDKEALAIGGLMSNRNSDVVRRIPLLSSIPIIGELFKTKSTIRRHTELIIIVTPQIVAPGAPVPIAQPNMQTETE